MWFKRLTLKNVGPHKTLDLHLKRGLIGVFGPNGSGKSTILDLMYAAVTNDFGRFDGVKTDCINNTCGEKEESCLYAEVEHNGRLMKITRRLRGKPLNELQVDGEEPITNSEKVEEKIAEVLGVDRKMLDLFCFKRQDKIYDFMVATDAERKKAFQSLCQTEVCEELWDMLGEHLNKDTELNTEIVDNSDELSSELGQLQEQDQQLAGERKGWEEQLLNGKSEESARDIPRKARKVEDLVEERGTKEAELPALRDAHREAKDRKARREEKLAELQQRHKQLRGKAQAAGTALKAWTAYQKQVARKAQLEDARKALGLEGRKNPAPDQPDIGPDSFDEGAMRKQEARLRRELEVAQDVVATFEAKGVTECPTCGTSVTQLDAHLKAQREIVLGHPKKIDSIQTKLEAIEEYRQAQRKWERWKAGYDERLKANQSALKALEDLEQPEGKEEDLKEVIAEFEQVEADLDTQRKRVANSTQEEATTSARVTACQERLAEIRQAIEENTVPADKVERARTRLSEHQAASQQIAKIDGQRKEIERSVTRIEQEIRKLRARLKRSRRLKKMASILQRAREVLHRDRLPTRVAQTNLARMEGDVNEGLGFFNDPFWVESSESLQFVVHKPGQPAQPAGRLSTGQKVVLAISFWLAVASLWKAEIGMLALDEPTANLDEDNRGFLAEALGSLTAKVREQRQVIMVTHADNLRSAFEQVIDLGG